MADVLTVQDLEAAKKHDTFHGEVITGKAGAVASGADIDTATNAVTGQIQTTLPKIFRDVGFKPVSFNFVTGGTLGVTDADKCIYNPSPAGDDNWYSWGGNLPHAVAPGTDPTTVGSGYVPRTDVVLRNDLANASNGFAGFVFSDVSAMKSATPIGFSELSSSVLSSDQMARTMSYHGGWSALKDPLGGAAYTITTLAKVRAVRGVSWAPDGYVDHYLAVGDGLTYVAVILTGESISIEQAGAIPDNSSVDNYNRIQASLNWANTDYGRARQVTAGVGEFYYSKTLLIDSLQPDYGICSGIIGAGWARTYLVKTTNTPADGTADYSVDAYIAYKTRSQTQTLYCYSSQLKHMTCKSTAANRHAYGVYGKLVSHMDWEEFEVQSAQIGVYSFDAWLIRWGGVRANLCDLGFKIGGTGTTLGWKNVWAHNCKDGGYDITGVVYAELSNCAADHIFDPDNPTVNKVAYKFKNCQGIHLSGCGTENVSEAFLLDNSIFKATSFRVNSIRSGAAGQTLIRAVNGAGGSFDTCGFTSVPATSAIAVQSKDATSYLSFENCAFQIANSGVPNDPAHRRNGLTTNMPLDVMGLKTVRSAMNGATWMPLTPLKSGCGFQIIAGVADGQDRYITLTKPFWSYNEISSNPASPTTIGALANEAGVTQTNLRASRVVNAQGVEMLQVNFSGSSTVVTVVFTLVTAQHW